MRRSARRAWARPRPRRSSARSAPCRPRSSRWPRCRTPCCSRARSRPRSRRPWACASPRSTAARTSRRTCCGCSRDTTAASVLRSAMEGSAGSRLSTSEQVALRYAEILTRTVNLAPSDFERVAATFNDSEIVELTMTVSFFNFFTRYTEALNLPVESWALDGAMTWPARAAPPTPKPRIALLADDEITAAAAALAQAEGSGRPAGAEQPRPRHGQLAARDAARAGHPAGVARVRQQLPREGHHRPRHPAAGVVRGVDRQRVPLLHAPPGAGAAAPRRRPDQAAGDAQGRLGADAARAGGGEVRAQAHRSAVRDQRRGLRRGEEGVRRRRRARGACCRPATSPS